MIDLARLEREAGSHAATFAGAAPLAMLVVDDFLEPGGVEALLAEVPEPDPGNRSRDALFARAKYENSGWADFGPSSNELFGDLTSDRFRNWLGVVTSDAAIFVDDGFHGAGLQQTGPGGYLDPHIDFNRHPLHPDWIRRLNILLYLNPGWEPAWRGELDVRHRTAGAATSIEPLSNRCLVMATTDATLHGYGPIAFPSGTYRRSIATYAYSTAAQPVRYRSTTWFPEAGRSKQLLGRAWPHLVRIKNQAFGSATTRNR